MTIPMFDPEPQAVLDEFAIALACEGIIAFGRLLPAEQREALRRLAATGRHAIEIVDRTGVSKRTIERVRAELRRETPVAAVIPAPRKEHIPAEQLDLLRALAATPLTVAVVAERTGVSPRTVERVRAELRREASVATLRAPSRWQVAA
ncbi:Hypothetical protein AJAP_42875 (plasmid) [Amycolatopsis japonica]|uniref:Uncharacterized protein n=1 Tax=Amycolatopsis japonica TaxID=208439 RepID=A0A075V4Q0_9PSEU|nr:MULTISPECIES: hypothetical protein [Amycolatopsis]AIG81342.1 Hypothetical protein AJAP_42875 [Amycolatopsis japonica]RSN38529.1 hypothetical protein DMC64_41415 [Amycolatopsis sp. WAC 04197]